MRVATAALIALGLVACSDTETVEVPVIVPGEIPACSAAYPTGACEAGQTCFQGACVATATLCSASNQTGTCPGGYSCYGGGCILTASVPTTPAACSPTAPTGTCGDGQTCFNSACVATVTLCSATNPTGSCPAGWACYGGGCILAGFVPPAEPPTDDPCAAPDDTLPQPTLAFAAAKPLKADGSTYKYDDDNNAATPTVEVPYVQKAAITVAGKQYRDLNGNGQLDRYEDWRYAPICRAKHLATLLTVPQMVGLMNSGGTLGNGSANGDVADNIVQGIAYGHRRQGLTRFGFTATQSATYFNNVQAMVEGLPLGIPAIVSADPVHSVNASMSADGTMTISKNTMFTNWSSTLGLGAINDVDLTRRHGECVSREFRASGLRWQLGPMADMATEPRWGRVPGTLGSEAQHVAKHTEAMVIGFQGSATGDLRNGIAATLKHFPGHGAEDDGMDAHTYIGRFNVYPGENLEQHFIPFQAAFDVGAASIMPCYSIYKGQFDYDPLQIPSGFVRDFVTGLAKERMGFTGMVTGDWGTATSRAFNMELLTGAERAAMWVQAGSHQYGSDSNVGFQQAFDQGLLTRAQLEEVAAKILEMTFKVGAFENPYTDVTDVPNKVRTVESRTEGFESMKKAIVLLRNTEHTGGSVRYLPINGTRYADKTGGTTGAPDLGEFACDTDGDGTVEVYYDGGWDSIVGPADPTKQDDMTDIFGNYDYTSVGSGTPGTAGFTLPVVAVAAIADADIAVIRIVPRGSAQSYEGLLSYDGVLTDAQLGGQTDSSVASAAASKKKVLDAFRVRDGYVDAAGVAVPAAKPTLKIVLVQQTTRPGIVKPFINGLLSLNETPGVPGSYPSVSDEANIVQSGTLRGVDAFLADFGAWDRAVLDFVFNKNVPAGFTYGQARLPMEIPNSDAAVRAQYEDVPNDSLFPTYSYGAGSTLPQN